MEPSSSSNAFQAKRRNEDRITQFTQQMIDPQIPAHEFFDCAYELHVELINQLNSGDLDSLSQHTADQLHQSLKQSIILVAESESTLNPSLSPDSARKLLSLVLRSIYLCQFVTTFQGVSQPLVSIFESLKAQEVNYFDVNNENEDLMTLILLILAVESGTQPRELLRITSLYRIDCSKTEAEINRKLEAHMSTRVVIYDKKEFEIKKTFVRQDFAVQDELDIATQFRILKHMIFNFSRLYYITEQRINQLVLGLHVLNNVLRITELQAEFNALLFENVQTSELIFLAGIQNAETHQIFRQYKNKHSVVPKQFVLEIGFLSLDVIAKLFSIQLKAGQIKMNSKLFNANFCSNLQQFLKVFISSLDLEDLDDQLEEDIRMGDTDMNFPNEKQEVNKQNELMDDLQLHVQTSLQKNCPQLFQVNNNILKIQGSLMQISKDYKAENITVQPPSQIFAFKPRFIFKNQLEKPQTFVNIEYKLLNQYAQDSLVDLKAVSASKQITGDDFAYNPFQNVSQQLVQIFSASEVAESQSVQLETKNVVTKHIEEQRIKYLLSVISELQLNQSGTIQLIISLFLDHFTKNNEKSDVVFADYCLYMRLFSDKMYFSLLKRSGKFAHLQTIVSKSIFINLSANYTKQLIPTTAFLLKLAESNQNNVKVLEPTVQLLQFLLRNETNTITSTIYETLTDDSLKVSQIVCYWTLSNIILATTDVNELTARKRLTKLLVDFLQKLKIQQVPTLISCYFAVFPQYQDIITKLVAQSMVQQVYSGDYDSAILELVKICQLISKSDFFVETEQNDTFQFSFLYFIRICEQFFDPTTKEPQQNAVFPSLIDHLDPLLHQLINVVKIKVSDGDKNKQQKQKFLYCRVVPGIIKLISLIAQYNTGIISKFVTLLKDIQIQISEQIIDEVIALIISKPGKLMHEPLEIILNNAESIDYKLGEKIIISISNILNFQLEYSAIDRKYPQFCSFALNMLEKIVSKQSLNVEQKLSLGKSLIQIASKADYINLYQILSVLRLLTTGIKVPIMKDFLDGLYQNMIEAQNQQVTQFVFQTGAGITYKMPVAQNQKALSVLISFKTRPMKQDNPLMCLFSILDSQRKTGVACFLRTICINGKNELVLRISIITPKGEEPFEHKKMDDLIQDGKEGYFGFSLQQQGDDANITIFYDAKPLYQVTTKVNVIQLLSTDAVLHIGYNAIVTKYQIMRQQNHFIGTMKSIAVFDDFLTAKQTEEIIQSPCLMNYNQCKQFKSMKKCRAWFSAQYTVQNTVINMAVNLFISVSLFCTLQKNNDTAQFTLQQDLTAKLEPGCEIRKNHPIEFQLRFVSGPNLFLCLIQTLANQEIDHQVGTLESILKLLTMIISKQSNKDTQTQLSIAALVSLMHQCPTQYITTKSIELICQLTELDIPTSHKTQIYKFLFNLDFMKHTNVLSTCISVMRNYVNQYNQRLEEYIYQPQDANQDMLVSILSCFSAIGVNLYKYINENSDISVEMQNKLLDIQEKSIINSVLASIIWSVEGEYKFERVMNGQVQLPLEVYRLFSIILQKLVESEKEEIGLSCLKIIKVLILLNILQSKVLEQISKEKLSNNNYISVFTDMIAWKFKKAQSLNQNSLCKELLKLIIVVLSRTQQQIKLTKQCMSLVDFIEHYYQLHNEILLKVIEKDNIRINIKHANHLLGSNRLLIEQNISIFSNEEINNVACDGLLSCIGKKSITSNSIILPYIFFFKPDLLLPLLSNDHNLKVAAHLDQFYDLMIADRQSLQIIRKAITQMYRMTNLYSFQQLVKNMNKFKQEDQQEIKSYIFEENTCMQINAIDFVKSFCFVCQATCFQESQQSVTNENLRMFIIEYLTDKLKMYNKNKGRKEKIELTEYVKTQLTEFETMKINSPEGQIILSQYVLHIINICEQIIPSELSEADDTQKPQTNIDSLVTQILKVKQHAKVMKENLDKRQFQMAQIQIQQVLHKSAISEQVHSHELSQIETASRIRNKIIPFQPIDADACTIYMYKQENVKLLQVSGQTEGTLFLSFDENGFFTLYFVAAEYVLKIQRLTDIIQQRYLFEWRAIEAVTKQHQFYYFIFEDYRTCIALIDEIKRFSGTHFEMKQKEIISTFFDFIEFKLMFKDNNTNQDGFAEQGSNLADAMHMLLGNQADAPSIRIVSVPGYPQPRLLIDPLQQLSSTTLWVRRCISNYDYLMILNTYAGRTFNDLAHYPVMPWVLQDYSSESIDLDDHQIYRDFSMPIGSQGLENKMRQILNKFTQSQDIVRMMLTASPDYAALSYQDIYGVGLPPTQRFDPLNGDVFSHVQAYHHACFYTTSAYVSHYLVRLQPYTQRAIDLDKRIDVARGFVSIPAAFTNIWSNDQDNRELIPEFFTLPAMFKDSQKLGIGDVELPPWASTPEQFVRIHRDALESEFVSQNLHLWIDLIFGWRQQGVPAAEKMNTFGQSVFYESQFHGLQDTPMKQMFIDQARNMALNFGQAPALLFDKPHIERQIQVKQQYIEQLGKAQELQLNSGEILNIYIENQSMALIETNTQIHKIELKEKAAGLYVYRSTESAELTKFPNRLSTLTKEFLNDYSDRMSVIPVRQRLWKNETMYLFMKRRTFKRNVRAFANNTIYTCNFIDDSIQVWQQEQQPSFIQCYAHVTCVDAAGDMMVFGSADGSVSIFSETGVLPICNLHSEVISVSINALEDLVAVAAVDQVQLYTCGTQFIKSYKINDVRHIKLRSGCLFLFTTTHIMVFDVPSMALLKQTLIPVQVDDLVFGSDFFILIGEKQIIEHRQQTLEIVQRWQTDDAKCVEVMCGEQILVIGRGDGIVKFIIRG